MGGQRRHAGGWLVGPLCLWGIAGLSNKPPKDAMIGLQQTKGQEYVAGFVKGYSDINKKQKRKAVKGGVLTFLAAAAVLTILRRIESLDVGGYFHPY